MDKKTFIVDQGIFCYVAMLFGLKNGESTYQRMINAIFHWQNCRNLETYVDNVLVKSKRFANHLEDLRDILNSLRKYCMNLNPKKC